MVYGGHSISPSLPIAPAILLFFDQHGGNTVGAATLAKRFAPTFAGRPALSVSGAKGKASGDPGGQNALPLQIRWGRVPRGSRNVRGFPIKDVEQ